jgi:hypothetical protein
MRPIAGKGELSANKIPLAPGIKRYFFVATTSC